MGFSGTKGGLANRQLPSNKKNFSSNSLDFGLYGPERENSAKVEEHNTHNAQEIITCSRVPVQYSQISSNSTVNTHSTPSTFRTDLVSLHAAQSQANQQQQQQQQQPLHVSTGSDSWNSINYTKPPKISYPVALPKPPPSLAEQLKQVLAERERRLSSEESPPREELESSKVPSNVAEEIKLAVNEANSKVRKIIVPQILPQPNAMQPWQQQQQTSPMREVPPSPSTISSSGSVSPGGATGDSLLSSADSTELWCTSLPQEINYSGDRRVNSHFWQSSPITDWSKEQVKYY